LTTPLALAVIASLSAMATVTIGVTAALSLLLCASVTRLRADS
jgi:hypothetical protein